MSVIRPRHGGWRRLMWWKRLHPAAELVCGLLMAGKGWKQTEYHLDHESCKVSMWIANRWYGFELAIDGRPASLGGRKIILDRWSRAILIAHVKAFIRSGNCCANDQQIIELARRVTREFTEQIKDRAA